MRRFLLRVISIVVALGVFAAVRYVNDPRATVNRTQSPRRRSVSFEQLALLAAAGDLSCEQTCVSAPLRIERARLRHVR